MMTQQITHISPPYKEGNSEEDNVLEIILCYRVVMILGIKFTIIWLSIWSTLREVGCMETGI